MSRCEEKKIGQNEHYKLGYKLSSHTHTQSMKNVWNKIFLLVEPSLFVMCMCVCVGGGIDQEKKKDHYSFRGKRSD